MMKRKKHTILDYQTRRRVQDIRDMMRRAVSLLGWPHYIAGISTSQVNNERLERQHSLAACLLSYKAISV